MAQMAINYLAVLVSGIVCMFIGFLWYGPLFGKIWMKLMNFDKKKMDEIKKKGMRKTAMFIAFIGALVMSYILALLINRMRVSGFSQGMLIGFLVWLGFFVTTKLGMMLWEGKPVKLYFLNVFHDLVVLLIVSGLLASWH